MKKLFIFMVTVVLAFAVGCQNGTGSDTSKESEAFTYEVTDEGTICITGVNDASVSELVIPKKIDGKPVTEIGRYAFYECENLKSVELTNVEKVGKGAFSGCVNLESVSMPKVGETVVFGSYEQDNNTENGKEEIEWLVLEKTEDRMLVISKYALDCQPYHEEWVDDVTWETCTLRKWLNNEFLNTAFTAEEQKLIPIVTVTAEDNPTFGTDAGNDTKDKVFLLSIAEAEEYFADNEARKCESTAYGVKQGVYVDYDYSSSGSCVWWLRSPGFVQGFAAFVNCDGRNIFNDDYIFPVQSISVAVRPALWINLNP